MLKRCLLLLSLMLCLFVLISCGAEGTVAEPAKEPAEPLQLIGENAPQFWIIRKDEENNKTLIDSVVTFRKALMEKGMDVKITTDWEKNPVYDYEIIIGDTSRYNLFDTPYTHYSAGPEGYFIYVQDGHIFIDGGSTAAITNACNLFIDTFFTGENPGVVPGDYEDIHYQKFPVDNVTIAGVSLRDFRIKLSSNTTAMKNVAKTIQEKFYKYCGIWLPLLSNDETWEGPCFLLSTDVTDADGYFQVAIEDGNLVIKSAYAAGFSRGFDYFWTELFEGKSGTVALDGGVLYQKDISKITYKEFGAVGDGKTNDLPAIIATHEFANESGLTVMGDVGATYYIGEAEEGAIIKTDTNWLGCTFIIDDTKSNSKNSGVSVFTVASDKASVNLKDVPALKAGATSLGVTLASDSVVYLKNTNQKRFVRYSEDLGIKVTKGQDQQEIIVVGKDGKISSDTPLTFDFDAVTTATAYPIDEKPLTILGGTFITIANKEKSDTTTPYRRGILINRSNVTVDGLSHSVQESSTQSTCYAGILYLNYCTNVTVKNCTFSGHVGYDLLHPNTDITALFTANLTFRNCTQCTNINDTTKWGLFTSSYCKNLTFDTCSFSRIDAGMGVQNLTVKNSLIGYQGITVNGWGNLTVENSHLYSSSFIELRSDYGSFWLGDCTIKNCEWTPVYGKSLAMAARCIFSGTNASSVNYGVACAMPTNITIDGLKVNDLNHTNTFKGVYLFSNIVSDYTGESYENNTNINHYTPTKQITISNFKSASDMKYNLSTNEYMYHNTKIVEK